MKVFLPPHTIESVGSFSALSQSVPWSIAKSSVKDAWQHSRGKGIVVAAIDTGFSNHPDNCNEVKGPSFVPSEPDGTDLNGHGSHVAGIIGACDNQAGIVGVAPEATVISIKALDKNGSGDSRHIANALRWALQSKVDVVNLSLGSVTELPPAVHDAIKALYAANIPIVCAAGNFGSKVGVLYPAKWQETIAIGAFDARENIADFSATGFEIDFAAPGVDILSTFLDYQYAVMSGTSMAAPFVTGVVALLMSKRKIEGLQPFASPDSLYHNLEYFSNDLGPKGWDSAFGFGVIAPAELLQGKIINPVPGVAEKPVIPQAAVKVGFWRWLFPWLR